MFRRKKIISNPSIPGSREVVERVTENGFPADSVVVYKERRNELRWFPAPEIGDYKVNVKAFQLPRFPNNFVYRSFRRSKARRSYENACRLLELGFLTPAPVGYSEEHIGIGFTPSAALYPTLRHSYYFSRQLPYPNIRGWEERPDFEEFIEALGAEIARLHRAGVWFLDFSPGNILVNRTAQGKYEFYYVDLNRTRFDITDHSSLMQMFHSISWSLGHIALLARAYAKAAGTDPEVAAQEAQEAARQWQHRFARKDRLKERLGIKQRQERERARLHGRA